VGGAERNWERERRNAHMLEKTLHVASTEKLGDERLRGEPF
jgi:hypothetical protein